MLKMLFCINGICGDIYPVKIMDKEVKKMQERKKNVKKIVFKLLVYY